MIPLSKMHFILDLPSPGFASVYAFSEQDALLVRERGHSRGLSEFSVWADRVAIDIDQGDEGLLPVLSILDAKGLGYEVWSSGGKGYHVFIPHEPIYSPHLPYSHLSFLRSIGVSCDETIYQHSRVLRLPGTVHLKTGKRKQFYMRKDGMQPTIPIVERPKFDFKPGLGTKSFQSALMGAMSLITNPPPTGQGKRHTLLWGVAKDFAEAGTPYLTALGVLLEVNRSWQKPKPVEKVELAVSQAYRQMGCEAL
jgi:hypothetical protein